jgi:isopenicillin-N epimerase
MDQLRAHFQLDPDIVFLNHGSFGATPRPVFAAYQEWQRRLERQPVRFFQHELLPLLHDARSALAAALHADPLDLVFVHNATVGVNTVARSLHLQPGDEILTTNHEYGACSNAWELVCRQTGARYMRQPIDLPATTPEAIVAQLWAGVTPHTRVIYLSHITSPTALTLPVAAICARARAEGILTVVDGAHAPGQIDLDLTALDADVYTGNLHKWLCAPKGAGFLWVRRDVQPRIEPLVVSWGYGPERSMFEDSDFVSALQWQGTGDYSAYLAVPAAIQFQAEHDWPAVRARCHDLLRNTLDRIAARTGLSPVYPHDAGFYHQMAFAPIPPQPDLPAFKQRLYDAYRIEIPGIAWQGRQAVRISVQGYNTEADLDVLVDALGRELG